MGSEMCIRDRLFLEVNDTERDTQTFLDHEDNIGFEQYALFGPGFGGIPPVPMTVDLLPNVCSLIAHAEHLHSREPKQQIVDRLELCSCADGTGRISMRTNPRVSPTDMLTDVQFADVDAQQRIQAYFQTHPPGMTVLTTSGDDYIFPALAMQQLNNHQHFIAFIPTTRLDPWISLLYDDRLFVHYQNLSLIHI